MVSRSWTARITAIAAVAALAVSGCSKEDVGHKSHDAGHDYGSSLVKNFGDRLSKAQLEKACAESIVDGQLHDLVTEKHDKVSYVAAEFVKGCTQAVSGN